MYLNIYVFEYINLSIQNNKSNIYSQMCMYVRITFLCDGYSIAVYLSSQIYLIMIYMFEGR